MAEIKSKELVGESTAPPSEVGTSRNESSTALDWSGPPAQMNADRKRFEETLHILNAAFRNQLAHRSSYDAIREYAAHSTVDDSLDAVGHYRKALDSFRGGFSSETLLSNPLSSPFESASSTEPVDLVRLALQIDSDLINAATASEALELSNEERAEHFAALASELVELRGAAAVSRLMRFLSDLNRRDFAPAAIVALSETWLPQKYDDEVLSALTRLLRSSDADVRYAALSGLGRRKGSRALEHLRSATALVNDDPVLSSIAEDYLNARGSNASKIAQAS